jgi:hypothetical protein
MAAGYSIPTGALQLAKQIFTTPMPARNLSADNTYQKAVSQLRVGNSARQAHFSSSNWLIE